MTLDELRSLLHYDPGTGIWTWRSSLNRRIRVGARAGCIIRGYRKIKIHRANYYSSRLAWLYVTGAWPTREIDHINQDRADDRFCNLRLASRSENMRNRGKQKNNRSGFKGVFWDKREELWRAQIQHHSRNIGLGYFASAEDAYAAYCAKGRELHGEFFRG